MGRSVRVGHPRGGFGAWGPAHCFLLWVLSQHFHRHTVPLWLAIMLYSICETSHLVHSVIGTCSSGRHTRPQTRNHQPSRFTLQSVCAFVCAGMAWRALRCRPRARTCLPRCGTQRTYCGQCSNAAAYRQQSAPYPNTSRSSLHTVSHRHSPRSKAAKATRLHGRAAPAMPMEPSTRQPHHAAAAAVCPLPGWPH